jgi:hypothetical protein
MRSGESEGKCSCEGSEKSKGELLEVLIPETEIFDIRLSVSNRATVGETGGRAAYLWRILPARSDLSNMWINRDLSYIFANGAQFESILVQGPRQVGKSAFLEHYAGEKPILVVLDDLALLSDRANRAQ